MDQERSVAPTLSVAQLVAQEKATSKWSLTPALIRLYACLIPACLLVCATNGFDGSVLTGLQGVSAWKEQFNHPQGTLLGLISACYPLGAICSTPFSAAVSDRFGRRWSILSGSLIMICGVIMQTACNTVGVFAGGRVIIGFGVTMALTAAPVLISELTHPRHRVIMGAVYNTSFYLGALLAGWITFGSYPIPSSWAWRLPTLFQAGPALLQTCFIWSLDESPRWLVYKDRTEEARAILVKYHGNGDEQSPLVHAELYEIREALRVEKQVKTAGIKLFLTTPGNRKRLFIIVTLAVFGQWSGNGLVSYYLTKILSSIGIKTQHDQTMINGTIQTVNWTTAIFAAVLASKIGRRKMFVGGAVAMFFSFASLTTCIAVYDKTHSSGSSKGALAMIFIYYATYNICLNPLLFLYPTEILPFRMRAMGLSILIFSNKSASFLNQFVNPIGMDSLGWKYYLVYVGWLLVEVAVFYFVYPETAGLSLETIGTVFGDDVPDADRERALGKTDGATTVHEDSVEYDNHDTIDTQISAQREPITISARLLLISASASAFQLYDYRSCAPGVLFVPFLCNKTQIDDAVLQSGSKLQTPSSHMPGVQSPDREPQKSPGLSFDLPQDNIVSNIRPQDDHRASIVTSRSLPKSPALDLNGANERLGHNPEMTHLNEQIEGLERVFKTRAMDHASKREMYSAQPMLRDGRAVLNKTRVFGRSHWLNTAYHFSEMQEFFGHRAGDSSSDPEIRSLRLEIEQLFNQCKFTAQVRKMPRPSRCFPPAPVVVAAPLREEAEQMGQLYFVRLESSFRILHSPSYWVEHKQYYDNPENGSLTTLLKIQLVTAIGMGLQDEYASNAQTRVAALQWTLPAQSWVSGLLEKDRLTVDGFQVQCLLILARQILAIGGDLIWISAGTLVRTAMQMGLHRDPKHFPQMPPVQAEVRRRLWATVLELTVQSSLDSGMPPMISADDYDTAYPMDVDDDQIEMESSICNNQDKVVTNTSVQIILLKAIPVRLKILRSANGLCTEMFYDEVLAMGAELEEFRDQCLALSQRKSSGRSGLIKSDMPVLLLTRFLLTLHAPFAMRARTNQVFRGSLETYLSSALDTLSPEVSPDLKHLLIIGGGIFKNCVNNAALVLSNQIIAVEEAAKRGDITGEDTTSEGDLLKTSLNSAISLVEKRLRSGETNVKMFCTLHMALGHVTALQSGISVPLEIARHAKFALEKALSILMDQQDPEFPVTELSDRWMSMSENTFIDDASWTYPVDFTSTLDLLC